jgi:hypothetical protein
MHEHVNMGLNIVLYKLVGIHECPTKRCVGTKYIFQRNRLWSKIPTDIHDVPLPYTKYKCECKQSVLRPNVGIISWSDTLHFGTLYNVTKVASFHYGCYSSFREDILLDMSNCSGTYIGSKLNELYKQLIQLKNQPKPINQYIKLLSEITDFNNFIVSHC